MARISLRRYLHLGERSADWEQLARSLHASYLQRWGAHDRRGLERATAVEAQRRDLEERPPDPMEKAPAA